MRYRIAFNRMALAEKLPQGDRRWGEFNDGFENLTLDPHEIANLIYRGYAFTTWMDGRRSLDNFICGQHIAVDMDTEDERSTLDALEAHPWVRMYGAMVYTTPSHTDAKPRARVLFLLDQPVENANAYGEAVTFVMAQFDDPDTSCKDASRFFYGSKDCSIVLPCNVLPLAQLRRLYAIGARINKRRRVVTKAPAENVINLAAERSKRTATQLTEQTPDELDKAIAALGKIQPYSVDYNRWIGIIAAMKREFGDSAFGAVEAWAQGKPGEVRREWDRMRTDSSKSMHLGTIYFLAAGQR